MSSLSNFVAPEHYQADGFVIRAYKPGDGAPLQRALVESYEHLRVWMIWANPDQTVEECETRCRKFAAEYLLNTNFVLGIWKGDELAGSTGFHLRVGPIESRNAEIGMWIRASQAGKGLGTKALRALLDWGFMEWGWERLVWKCDTRNVASTRVAEKCGMQLEGTLRKDALDPTGCRRDTHLYGILKEDWAAVRPS